MNGESCSGKGGDGFRPPSRGSRRREKAMTSTMWQVGEKICGPGSRWRPMVGHEPAAVLRSIEKTRPLC